MSLPTERQTVETAIEILRPKIAEARREGFPEREIEEDVSSVLANLAKVAVERETGRRRRLERRAALDRVNREVMAALFPSRN